jgi:hypothetical protein
MSLTEYNEKLKDPRWQRKRLKIFERDSWTCQLCSRTDLELNVHHLYRTTEEPWDEPDLHLLTLCRLCHEQQLNNPRGGFKPPRRLYKTDAEWWKEHCHEYDCNTQDRLDTRKITGFTIREIMAKLREIHEGIHALRLAWEEKRDPPLCPED